MPDALDVRGLRKTFGEVVAVDEITFSAGPGRTVGLLGADVVEVFAETRRRKDVF